MTKKVAITILNQIRKILLNSNSWLESTHQPITEAFDMAIEALAQPEQSTEVQDILQFLDEHLHPIVSPEHWNVYSELYDMISCLPSAQPEGKTGRWIRLIGMMPPEYTGRHYCSECDEFAPVNWKTHREELTDYCPHCGIKMEVEG